MTWSAVLLDGVGNMTLSAVLPENESCCYPGQKIHKILDKGFIGLVDIIGNDQEVVNAARVSYGNHLEQIDSDATNRLIRYLMRHEHMTPFEMCELKFLVKCPIFVAREWMRHRTFAYNEISARYKQLEADYYVPHIDRIGIQSKDNKQGTDETPIDPHVKYLHQTEIEMAQYDANQTYDVLCSEGVARELARIVMPVGQYTEFYVKGNLRNWLHFCQLRCAKNAQYEIRQYAQQVSNIIAEYFPLTYAAWRDYKYEAVTFSKQEMEWLRNYPLYLNQETMGDMDDTQRFGLTDREWNEFKEKLNG